MAATQVPLANVLVVDDFTDNLELFETVLTSESVRVVTAQSGSEALELLDRQEFALAIVDVNMPEMNGLDLARRMRNSEWGQELPIIIITALTDERLIPEAYSTGAVDLLRKPTDSRILASKAAVFLELYRQKKQLLEQIRQEREMTRITELLVAAIGHDLRGPLQTMIAGASVLRSGAKDELSRSVAVRVQSAGMRMSTLIADLLDFFQFRLSSFPISRVPADVLQTARKVVAEYQLVKPNAQLHLSYEGSAEGTLDEARLSQVLSNLIGNALTHGADATVHIAIDGTRADYVEISVHNRGAIPTELLLTSLNRSRAPIVRKQKTAGLVWACLSSPKSSTLMAEQ